MTYYKKLERRLIMNANAKEVIGRINGVDEKLISERPGMYSPQVSVNVNEKYTVSFNKP
jgi:hypothetical protein